MTDRLHDLGIMINGSFVFGMDDDDEDVFRRTVDWAIEHGITTATFHIQTPYPGTRLFARMRGSRAGSSTRDWDLYDTRHVVYRPARLHAGGAEAGLRLGLPRVLPLVVDRARRRSSHGSVKHQAKHFFYAAGWKKFEPLWDLVIRAQAAPAHDAAARRRPLESDGEGAGFPDARAPAAPSPLPIANPRIRPS